MIVVDANLLLYAYDSSSQHHTSARRWLEGGFRDRQAIRLPWLVITAFLRITTNFRAMQNPFTEQEACTAVSALLAHPSVAIINPGIRHWPILERLVNETGTRGPLMMDAHLAALAIEHGATLCTNDRDFSRFPGLRLEYPLSQD
jgi:toxin-antitoxin system PIN domain toxin